VGGPTDGRDIVISDHYEAKKRQLKGHGWRFRETHESFNTASVSRPTAGATVGLLSATSGLVSGFGTNINWNDFSVVSFDHFVGEGEQ
jgi:hypothetical protein